MVKDSQPGEDAQGTDVVLIQRYEVKDVARKAKQKMLTALPKKFDPNFIDRLSQRYALARIVRGRREALEAHLGGRETLSYVKQALIRRVLWLELLVERYEQQVANGECVDIGAISQLNNTLKGHYKDLGLDAVEKRIENPEDEIGKLNTRKPVTVDGTVQSREAEVAA